MSDDGYENGELISEALVNSAVVGVTYDEPGHDAVADVTADGLTVTATVTGANGDEHRGIDWGDGSPVEEVVLSDTGSQSVSHGYATEGTYTITALDSAGNALASSDVTVTAPVEEPSEPELFDPGDHTIAEVQAYLAEHPEEHDRILAAEQTGKNRATLIDALTSG